MKIIDFDAPFRAMLSDWIRENAGKYKNADELESRVGEAYLRFNNRRADWLDGLTPAEYFARFTDAHELVAALTQYDAANIAVPDLLMARIVELGNPSIAPLIELALNADAPRPARVTAINLLIELDTAVPMDACLRLVDDAVAHDELAEAAGELLQNLGATPVPAMLSRLPDASAHALPIYLDLLCNFPGDERIYTYTVREFLRDGEHRALYASLLGRLGDARALPALMRALNMDDINYLDYLEVASAVEALGGDAGNRDRDFAGDPYYESLSHLND